MSDTRLFIEATLPGGYATLWRAPEQATPAEAVQEALQQLFTLPGSSRLELWSKAWAETHKGFAPMAYRPANSTEVWVGSTLRMLFNLGNI